MILTLLTEVVALYMRPTAVEVRGFGLELVSRSIFRGLEECLEKEVHILLRVSGIVRSWRSRKWSLRGPNRSFKSLKESKFV